MEEINSADIKITEKYGRILNKFRILYHEWGMDGYGYVVDTGNKNIIVSTNHSRSMVSDTNYFKYKIQEYERTINETREALKLVGYE